MPELTQFGPYRFYAAGDLYKGRSRIRLQQHPMTVLCLLLERPGEIVTREEIRHRVWPNGTVVEFDHSINTAVNKLRSALGDRAEKPRYIETIARRGYRFIAPVQRIAGPATEEPAAKPVQQETLSAGDSVSHYRIVKKIGSGAVGTVYEAVDVNLDRRVALKFLTDAAAGDERAMERFGREARALSALDHPNIGSLYEFEEHAGRRFLAMQLLEGETLADRIRQQGRFGNDLLLDVALQTARGVEAAHLRGIIHRDIKPANIFLTTSGQVKILDFGLAKLGGALEPSNPLPLGNGARDNRSGMTLSGAVMGTAAYMSPEQIRGEEVDSRTDIFSFGLVLYEMCAGCHAFAAESDTDVAGRILHLPAPSPKDLIPDLPPGMAELIGQALERDRDCRISSFAAVREALEVIQRESSAPGLPASRTRNLWKVVLPVLIIVLAFAVWMATHHLRHSQPALTVVPMTSSPGLKEHVVMSPDGSRFAFAWYREGDNEDIFIQKSGSEPAVRLTSDAARDFSPAWSPDGRFLAFLRTQSGRSSYYIAPADGGQERKLGEVQMNPAPFCRQLDWSPTGEYLAVADWKPPVEGGPALLLVSAKDGAQARRLPVLEGQFLCAPTFSPDGRQLAFMQGPDFRVSDIYLTAVEGGPIRRLTFEKRMMQGLSWTSDGANIVYSLRRSGPFGLWQIAISGGEPRALLETGNDVVDPHAAAKGRRLIFVRDMWDTNLWRVEGPAWKGKKVGPRRVIASTREDTSPDVSPDGKRLVYASAQTGPFELWVSGIDGANARRLTYFNGPETGYPRWSPDGKWIAFTSYPEGQPAIFVMAADGGAPQRRSAGEMPFWSENGRSIYFLLNVDGVRGLWKVAANGGDPVKVSEISAIRILPRNHGDGFLYEQGGSLWTGDLTGREKELLVRRIEHGMWAPARGGACYLNYGFASSFRIECRNTRSGEVLQIADLGSWPRVYGPPGFASSPDEQWVFYHRTDHLESNIMLADQGSIHRDETR